MRKTRNFFAKLFNSLKDKTNIIIFIIVFLVLSSEVWVMYLLYFITNNAWFLGIGSACWAFWLAPFTPFLTLCIAITFGVRKLYNKLTERSVKKVSKPNNDV